MCSLRLRAPQTPRVIRCNGLVPWHFYRLLRKICSNRFAKQLVPGIALVILTACGSNADNNNTSSADAPSISVSLTLDRSTGIQSQLKSVQEPLDLSGLWHDWAGNESGIYYDPSSRTLRIPAPTEDIVVGVQRFDQPLPAGASLTLSVDSSSQKAAAVIFLFDAAGNVLPSGDESAGHLTMARQDNPRQFIVPDGVAGFYLQVQSEWQTSDVTSLSASLSEEVLQPAVDEPEAQTDQQGGNEANNNNGNAGDSSNRGNTSPENSTNDASTDVRLTGNNLVATDTNWLDWDGKFTGIVPSESGTQVFLPATRQGDQVIGVSRVNLALQAGVKYEFSLVASTGSASHPAALLWLINSQLNTVPFRSVGGQTSNWLRVAAGESVRFVVPADIIGFAVQLQTSYAAGDRALVTPGLRRVADERGGSDTFALQETLLGLLEQTHPNGATGYLMPSPDDLGAIPQSADNPVTAEKIMLGAHLFHETGLATAGNTPGLDGTWSCASCHHVAAGFKAGIPQGIGEGGMGFGTRGEGRRMGAGHDAFAPDGDPAKPDVQPVASPTILNTAYQPVMLWNGQFGNSPDSQINATVDPTRLMTAGTPKVANTRRLPGLEIQAVAGLGVHRLSVEQNSLLQTHPAYQAMFSAAFPNGSVDVLEDASKAIAAYERSVLATDAPFQRWLRGEATAMSARELRGAILFFGQAGCVACHQGPALSSEPSSSADETFFAIGFADFDLANPLIHGQLTPADRLGRGGFTGDPADNYKFKVPQLYNLADADIFGHGASFGSIRSVLDYKNTAQPQNPAARANLDPRFVPLGLNDRQIDDLDAFLSNALRDPSLDRYVPDSLPGGNCFPVADRRALEDLGCATN